MVPISFDFKEKLANKLNDQLLNNNAKLVFLILRDTRAHQGGTEMLVFRKICLHTKWMIPYVPVINKDIRVKS